MKRTYLVLTIMIALLALPSLAQAKAKESKWFLGIGGNGGIESLQIKAFGGGASLPFGYHINSDLSVYGLADSFFTEKFDVNYAFVSLLPMITYRFYNNFSFYGGGGYTLMHASRMGRLWDWRTNTKSIFHGFCGEVGLGYNPQVAKNVIVSPQIGLRYTHIAGDNLLTPLFRINLIFNL